MPYLHARACTCACVCVSCIGRFSAPFFFNPAYEAMIAPVSSLGEHNYHPISWGEAGSRVPTALARTVGEPMLRVPTHCATVVRLIRTGKPQKTSSMLLATQGYVSVTSGACYEAKVWCRDCVSQL